MNQENIFDKQRRIIYHELMQIGLEQQECWTEANLILEHVTGIKHAQQIISDLDHFKADWLHEITRIINSRRQRMPLAYCLGEVEFAGLSFRIIPGVLIPRPDTETLVQAVIDRLCMGGVGSIRNARNHWREHGDTRQDCRGGLHPPAFESHVSANRFAGVTGDIAEIGIGCGAIAISLLKRLPECTVWACDISETAITTTLGNARRHNVHDRLTLVHGDWKKVLPHNLNVVVSNPPYLPLSLQQDMQSALQPEVTFEPKSALFDGSEDGLGFYRQFAEKLPAHFAGAHAAPLQGNELSTPFAAFEIGDKQERSVSDIFKQSDWQDLSIARDIHGLPRVLTTSPPDINF